MDQLTETAAVILSFIFLFTLAGLVLSPIIIFIQNKELSKVNKNLRKINLKLNKLINKDVDSNL